MKTEKKVELILEDGSVFSGISFGSEKNVSGEVVFNTGMVGYNEALTDPSYRGQILVFTYPLIGNYGVPIGEEFFESNKIQTIGIVVLDYSFEYSHWNAKRSLQDWLIENNIPGITDIDTRALTKIIRKKGTMLGKIVFDSIDDFSVGFTDPNKRNLVSEVGIDKPIKYGDFRKTIALIDCGVKNSITRSLLERKFSVLRVPWDYNLFKYGYDFDGIFISNGPGNPKMVDETIETVKIAMEYEIPIFGICLGNQILALASGADTYKLKFGHRSHNQPCILSGTKKCFITTQNHGYAVNGKTLQQGWEEWFVNANDGTNEGIRHKEKSFFAVQFHPEANAGPIDTRFLFDEFLKIAETEKKG